MIVFSIDEELHLLFRCLVAQTSNFYTSVILLCYESAGIGILSVQAAYWLYPVISKTFFHKRYLKNTYISPYMSEYGKGISCTIAF